MLKPVGAACNSDCRYCYYPRSLVEGDYDSLSPALATDFLKQLLPHFGSQGVIVWQGGEPTLAGLDFYRESVRSLQQVLPTELSFNLLLQTNGLNLDEEWCGFLKENNFLVGLSLDGRGISHDRYRRYLGGQKTYQDVLKSWRLLQQFDVPTNILCVIHKANVHTPEELLQGFVDLGCQWIQFIPAVNWERGHLAAYSPTPAEFGAFLCRTFDLWFTKFQREISIQFFDAILNILVHGRSSLCVLASECPAEVTVEKTGEVYPCDHFAVPAWKLGRLPGQEPDFSLLRNFRRRKGILSAQCHVCQYLQLCHGGCPKHRRKTTGPTILCESYQCFFQHALPRLQRLAENLT